ITRLRDNPQGANEVLAANCCGRQCALSDDDRMNELDSEMLRMRRPLGSGTPHRRAGREAAGHGERPRDDVTCHWSESHTLSRQCPGWKALLTSEAHIGFPPACYRLNGRPKPAKSLPIGAVNPVVRIRSRLRCPRGAQERSGGGTAPASVNRG